MANTMELSREFTLLAILWASLIANSSGRRCPKDGVLAGYSGTLSSPHYPNEYPHRVSCVWIILVPRDYHVKIVFMDFDIEYCVFCKCDYVEIRDGRNSTAPLLGKFCQSSKLKAIFSTGRYLWIRFYSDVGGRFRGFQAVYKAMKNGKIFKDLIHVSGKSGIVASPQSTASCGTNRQCTWLIRARTFSHVKLSFANISLPQCTTPCTCGYIEVRDGTNASSRLIAKFCETIPKSENICSSLRHLWIRFEYGLDLTGYGFHAGFKESKCRRTKKVVGQHKETTGALDTVVGLLCASFTFMALMTFCMVCMASRKLARERKRQKTPQTPAKASRQKTEQMNALTWWPSENLDSCVFHTHAHWLYDRDTETEYSEELERREMIEENRTSQEYCPHCRAKLTQPIAVL